MKPSKPFLFCLALVAVSGGTVLVNAPSAHAAVATDEQGMPLSTTLTPAMIDYFGLAVAYEHPSLKALVACHGDASCGHSDSSQVRILDANGSDVQRWDGTPGSVIEQVRTVQGAAVDGVREWRRLVRQYAVDAHGRVVMNGSDSIVRMDAGAPERAPSRSTRVHRYSDVRYLVTDPRFMWPLTGLVVLSASNDGGQGVPATPAGHAAVSFDGTAVAHVITTGAVLHSADLQAQRLITTMPDR